MFFFSMQETSGFTLNYLYSRIIHHLFYMNIKSKKSELKNIKSQRSITNIVQGYEHL